VSDYTARFTVEELAGNYPLYAEGCLKIVNKQRKLVPLVLNYSQGKVQAAVDKFERERQPIRIIELKARQTGLSTDAEGRLFHRCHLRDNRQSLVIAHTEPSAKKIFNMARIFYDNMPPALHLPKRYFTKQNIEFADSHSAMGVSVAKNTGGRGFTVHDVHMSEAAFYPNLTDVFSAVGNAVPDDPDTIVIVESTPFGHNEFYEMWTDAKNGKNDYAPIFIPWHEEPLYNRRLPEVGLGVLTDEELMLQELYHVSGEQLQWRRWKIANDLRGDEEQFLQEYPSDDRSCFLASGRPAYDAKTMIHFVNLVPPARPAELPPIPPLCEITWDAETAIAQFPVTHRGRARLYRTRTPRTMYEIGIDPSEGISGGDRGAMAVLNRMTMDFEFFWYGFCPPEQLAVYADWLGRYYNEGELVPEFNNHGYSLVTTLDERGYPNIWRRPASFEKGADAAPSDRYGFVTSVRTRPWLFNGLRQYAINRLGRIEDPECVSEMLTQVYEGDKIIHLEGKHDDVPTAAALSLFGHRGNYENPLAPLTAEVAMRVTEEVQRRRSHGLSVRAEDLGFENVTAEDLEQLDEAEYNSRRSNRLVGRKDMA
jgi:hypothetical protein